MDGHARSKQFMLSVARKRTEKQSVFFFFKKQRSRIDYFKDVRIVCYSIIIQGYKKRMYRSQALSLYGKVLV